MAITASMVKELRQKTGAGMLDCKKALVATDGNIDGAIDWLREKGISKAAKKADRIAAEGLTKIKFDGNKAVILEVNSETDFVSKNQNFLDLVDSIADTLLTNTPKDMEAAMALETKEGTLQDTMISATAIIGEKLSFRRFEIVEKTDSQSFGGYLHLGGRIGVLALLEGANEEVAKDVAMHVAAMNPKYVSEEQVSAEEVAKEKAILREQALNEGKPEKIVDKMVEGRIRKYLQEICVNFQAFVKNPDVTVGEYAKNNNGSVLSFTRYEVGEGIEKKEDNFAEEVMAAVKG